MKTINKEFQRDAFIKEIYKAAKKDKKIYFLSADFGAPALDDFRNNLKGQFVHLGICEQNMIDFACGMALDGAKVYAYAMAPFLALRCIEQHKTATCLMNLNVCSIVTGIGLSYANSGPTHYSTEDLACLRSLPNAEVYTASDSAVAKMIARYSLKIKKPTFVRLDRKASFNFKKLVVDQEIQKGFRYIKKNNKSNLLIISHGTILDRALKAYEILNVAQKRKVDIIELIRCKPFPNELRKKIENYRNVLTVDEQTPSGGLKSIILENVKNNVCGLSLPDKFIYENLGREKLLDKNNLSIANILKNINRLIKNR